MTRPDNAHHAKGRPHSTPTPTSSTPSKTHHQVGVLLLEARVTVRGQELPVGVDVHAGALGALEDLLQVCFCLFFGGRFDLVEWWTYTCVPRCVSPHPIQSSPRHNTTTPKTTTHPGGRGPTRRCTCRRPAWCARAWASGGRSVPWNPRRGAPSPVVRVLFFLGGGNWVLVVHGHGRGIPPIRRPCKHLDQHT